MQSHPSSLYVHAQHRPYCSVSAKHFIAPQFCFLHCPQVVIASEGRIQVQQPIWISRMTASHAAGGWQLTGNNKGQGTYGAVVIAHNGKCANRQVMQHAACCIT